VGGFVVFFGSLYFGAKKLFRVVPQGNVSPLPPGAKRGDEGGRAT
jgi:hypothetical protein